MLRLDVRIVAASWVVIGLALSWAGGCGDSHSRTDVAAEVEAGAGASVPPQPERDVPGSCGSATPIIAPCTDRRESSAGKFSDRDAQHWQSAQASSDVMIRMKAEFKVCPELDHTQRSQVHEATQGCVKQLIEQLGGSVAPGETFWILNAFVARLDWEQIQQVAEHPDVRMIESNEGAPLP